MFDCGSLQRKRMRGGRAGSKVLKAAVVLGSLWVGHKLGVGLNDYLDSQTTLASGSVYFLSVAGTVAAANEIGVYKVAESCGRLCGAAAETALHFSGEYISAGYRNLVRGRR